MIDPIVPAEEKDLPRILELYAGARLFMAQNGNPDQWGRTGYPQPELLKEDIAQGRLYKVLRGPAIVGAFVLVFGDDPTYKVIENGAWLNGKPYGTLHRLCADTNAHGVAREVLSYCRRRCRENGADLRADTHEANTVMQHVLESFGFTYCGRIYVADGSPRKAYQLEIV